MSNNQKRMMADFEYLKKPNFKELSNEDQLFRVALIALLKFDRGFVFGSKIHDVEARASAYVAVFNITGTGALEDWLEKMNTPVT